MARTINDIQQSIITDLQTYFPKLSTSKVAEWRLWTYAVSYTHLRAHETL